MKTQTRVPPPRTAHTHAPQFEQPRKPLLPLIAAAVTIVVAALIGWLLGGSLRSEPVKTVTPDERVAKLGPLLVDLDASWGPVAAGRELDAMGMQDLAPFAPVAGLPGRAWVARANPDGTLLVPAGVRARLAKPLGKPQPARLAGRPAWTYEAVSLRSGGQLELTVQPTAAGVLVVGCEAAKTWWSTVAGCTRAVRGVSGAAALVPRADLAFRQRARTAIPQLNRARAAAGKALAGARRRAGQSAAAQRLVKAHAAAAAQLGPLAPAKGPARKVVLQLRKTAGAYKALARAARLGSRRGYAKARKQTRRSDAALRAALKRATS